MLDLFGKEAKRGDIIVSAKTVRPSGYAQYMTSQLGVILNILPEREWQKGSWQYNRVFNKLHNNSNIIRNRTLFPSSSASVNTTTKRVPSTNDPDSYPVCGKITFIPFDLNFMINTNKLTKNGTPIARPVLSNSFIIIDKSTLSEEWVDCYDKVCNIYKI